MGIAYALLRLCGLAQGRVSQGYTTSMADMNDDQRKLLNSRKQNTYDSVSTNNALGEEDDTPVSLLQGLNQCTAITAKHSRICNKGCFTRSRSKSELLLYLCC